ncbi:serine--tRNA ligase [candidate division WWE3 bacterium RIFOXYD1_FULL_39_9]|uniref:Serine--tRNA ligase n=1 Tax=candidate division WWE3 bacterium RIFOXYD1_FULL_39_9 TaxID=1802649 RepID=A0A1F4X8A6_UNCKA|nr:MAG: serine--tRNA ligase [candidate division WWE3 bacterium RIFOXYD1_FULL_39_9]
MLDIKYIKENKEIVKKALNDKQLQGTVDIDLLVATYDEYTELLKKVEIHRNLRNSISKDISRVSPEEKQKLLEEAKHVKDELQEMEEKLKVLKAKIDELMLWVPNVPAKDVPFGENEEGNTIIKQEGVVPEFSFEPKDHLELGEALGIIDTKRGAKLGGFRSYFLVGKGMLLEQAILRYALDHMVAQGFTPMNVPVMLDKKYFVGTGYFPWGSEDHYVTQDDLALVGTAEVSLTSYYADEVLDESQLPVMLAGQSPCFRREVGGYGKDTKGVFRVHYFTKVEQVVLLPEGEELSVEWHDKMLGFAEDILKGLNLSYRVLLMCTGDMGAGQRKKYDIETWFPSQKIYRETHSDSYFLDFQARRLNIRYKDREGKIKFVNTINNTVAATPRLLAAVIENYQQKDGSILVPEVLRKYTGFEKIEPNK